MHLRTFAAICVVAVVAPAGAAACSCGPPPPVPKALADAPAVFFGRCVSGRLLPDGNKREFTFEIRRVWKGLRGRKRVTLATEASSAQCGYDFRVGETYIVYCTGTPDALHAALCTRTCLFPSVYHDEEGRALDAAVRAK